MEAGEEKGKKRWKKREKKERKVPVPSAQDPKEKEILKAMKAKVDPQEFGSGGPLQPKNKEEGNPSGPEKRGGGGDVSAFKKALDQAVGEKANVKSLVSKRNLEVRDLDETVTSEVVVTTLRACSGSVT